MNSLSLYLSFRVLSATLSSSLNFEMGVGRDCLYMYQDQFFKAVSQQFLKVSTMPTVQLNYTVLGFYNNSCFSYPGTWVKKSLQKISKRDFHTSIFSRLLIFLGKIYIYNPIFHPPLRIIPPFNYFPIIPT